MTVWIALAMMAGVYLLMFSARYVLGARLYLTCAFKESTTRSLSREELQDSERRLLTLCDDELAAAGFEHLGFGEMTPVLTYYDTPSRASLFAHVNPPVYARVERQLAPEYGRVTQIRLATALDDGTVIETLNTAIAEAIDLPRYLIEQLPGAPVQALLDRHLERVANATAKALPIGTIDDGLQLSLDKLRMFRAQVRAKGWVVPTSDPKLDRFTVRGAFSLVHYSIKVLGNRKGWLTTIKAAPTDQDRQLRVDAELEAVLHAADHPEVAPGTPWSLLTIIATTAVLSLIGMTLLWNWIVAVVLLITITLHELGHAYAMRRLGYRDVHIFFVPLLGAVTIGQPQVTTVRDRIGVLLAGPVPGLWLAVVLVVIERMLQPVPALRIMAVALLVLNGLNLLPFTPLDGGRVWEALSKPESAWRVVVHGISIAGLLGLGLWVADPFVLGLAVIWIGLFPRQLTGLRLRRAIAAAAPADRADFRGVARAALEVMTAPGYVKMNSTVRQVTARAIARTFAESAPTGADRWWGAMAYTVALIPLLIGALLW